MAFNIERAPSRAGKPAVLLRQAWREGSGHDAAGFRTVPEGGVAIGQAQARERPPRLAGAWLPTLIDGLSSVVFNVIRRQGAHDHRHAAIWPQRRAIELPEVNPRPHWFHKPDRLRSGFSE